MNNSIKTNTKAVNQKIFTAFSCLTTERKAYETRKKRDKRMFD